MEKVTKTSRVQAIALGIILIVAMLFGVLFTVSPMLAYAEDDAGADANPLEFSVAVKVVPSTTSAFDSNASFESALDGWEDYTMGNTSTSDLAVILTINEVPDGAYVTYSYYASESSSADTSNVQWQSLKADEASADCKYAIIYMNADITSDLYYYFKADDSSSNAYSYTTTTPTHIKMSADGTQSYYAITNISAYYTSSTTTAYAIDTDESKVSWASKSITIEVSSGQITTSSVYHYYKLLDDEENSTIWYPAEQYDGYSLITLSDSYEGRIQFKATNASNIIVQEDIRVFYVKIDTTAPILNIVATKADGTVYSASTNGLTNNDSDWSDSAVTYTITPDNSCISGVTYYYYDTISADWIEMNDITSAGSTIYTYTVSTEGTTKGLMFRASSGSGIITTSDSFTTNIDSQTPVFTVSASDGSSLTSGAYASDNIEFTLNLTSTQQSDVYYYYKSEGGEYASIPSSNGGYVIKIYAPIINETYTFKVANQAGLYSEIEFVANVLESGYNLYVDEFSYETVNGWAYETIAVDMYLPTFIADADEYILYYMEANNESTVTEFSYTLAEDTCMWEGEECKKYTAYLENCVDGKVLQFFAINKASDESTYYLTTQIFLDNEAPDIDIEAYVGGVSNGVEVGYEVWANGVAYIYIIIEESNISGLTCYNVVSDVRGNEITNTATVDGKTAFLYSTDKSGLYTYSFVVVSGAGLETEISIDVGIDTSAITLTGEGYSAEANGSAYESGGSIATDLTIEFTSSHDGHFTYYYYQYTEYSGYTTELSKFTAGEAGVSTLVINPEDIVSGQLTVNYVFVLVSDAVNSDGSRVISEYMTLENVKLDTRTFVIEYDYTTYTPSNDSDGWYQSYTFYFTSADTNVITVDEMTFQIKLSDGEWINIDSETSDFEVNGNQVEFTYYGEEQEYDGTVIGTSYYGSIEFRALNTAGKASNSVGTSLTIKVDNITVDPFFAMDLDGGSRVVEEDTSPTTYDVYSTQSVLFAYSNDSLFNQMASITYYYATASDYEAGNGWTQLGAGDVVEMGDAGHEDVTYYVYASNIYNETAVIYCYKFNVQDNDLSGTMDGGIYGTQEGLLEYDWTSVISITFVASSDSDVYFWYSQGGKNDWVLINEDVLTAGVNQIIYFYADYDEAVAGGNIAVYLGNLQDTFFFKITNLAGDEFVCELGVIMKLESVAPTFELSFSVGSTVLSSTDLDAWQSDAVRITITPTDDDQNPGGVVYYYIIGEYSSNEERWSLIPGGGTSFTTNDLWPYYTGTGEVTITIIAVANADPDQVEYDDITIKIDSVTPDFEITGTAIVTGSSTARIVNSGDWMQSDTITLALFATVSSASTVSYTYILEGAASSTTGAWSLDASIDFNTICVVWVTATNEAGLTAIHSFEVNMDNDAPIIYSGSIVNNYVVQSDGTFKIDYDYPNTYYIDQMITYEEANLKSATYNNFPLSNGKIIGTNSVDNTNTGTNELGQGGYVYITIEDMAGNISELVFYMSVFPLDVNTITLSDEDLADLSAYEQEFLNAKNTASLTDSRAEYFEYSIERLYARVETLYNMVEDYQAYLTVVNSKSNFDLVSDYATMWTYYNYFTTADTTILYDTWLQELIKEGVYGDYYNKLQTELLVLMAQMEIVETVEDATILLPAINAVADEDYEDIMRVYNAYDSLTTDQKAVFKSTLYTKLIEVKRIVEVLLLQDEATGITIEGDDLASGVAIVVETYADSTELVNNAQLTILENYEDGTARAIVSTQKIYLSGYGSQYDTGTITITLTIPTDYQIYTKFAVYELSSDGTVTLMQDSMISADGTTVYFTASALGTYVLATNANVVYRDANEEIYGVIAGVEIDGTLLTYITVAAVVLFVLLVVIMIVVGVKHRWFLGKYNKAYASSRKRRNITRVPKGNNAPFRNPADPTEGVSYERKIYTNKDKDM
ncbi:MAG: hypothetical protein R3Y23_03975 [Bacillota bacterium]